MKKSLRLVGVCLGLVATHSFAEMVEVPVDDGTSDPIAVEADFFTSYIGGSDVHRGSIQINDFDEVNSLARILILPRTKVASSVSARSTRFMLSTFRKVCRSRIGCSRLP